MLDVLSDTDRTGRVRGQAAGAIAEQLEFSSSADPMRRVAEATLLELLHDPSPMVRFWSAFALGKLRTTAALPVLQELKKDRTPVPLWWTVGEEASDAIELIEGRHPPARVSKPDPGTR